VRGRRRLLALLALLPGCVYLNGIYNARQADEGADRMRRRGRDAQAAELYARAATKAESVLARHPTSDWRPEALYLAGRGWALSGDCARALPRLDEFLARPAGGARRATRARLARGMCLVRTGRSAAARPLLDSLRAAPDAEIIAESAVWAARAAFALGDSAGAREALRAAPLDDAQWELARVALAGGRLAAAESLLALRASRGDYRPEALDAIERLWRAGRGDGARRLVMRYDRAAIPPDARARLHLTMAELMLAAGVTDDARVHLEQARRAARDSSAVGLATARLTELAIRALPSIVDVEGTIARAADAAVGGAPMRRLRDNVLLVRMLSTRPDTTGASLFLAAEVARDSLGARALAHALFRGVVARHADSPVAPKALVAAAAVAPDSASAYFARVRALYPASHHAHAGNGGSRRVDPADALLRSAWEAGTASFADSVAVLRGAPADSAAAAAPPTPPILTPAPAGAPPPP
jgi:thioredoxin-like negative regulator of GroEL